MSGLCCHSASTQTFRWNAVDYAKSSSVQQLWARELIGKLALRGNDHVLDIGCGDGKITAEIASQVPKGSVLGIDSSETMIALAQSRFSEIQFQLGDASRLSFNNDFDVVFSSATLHWILDHQPVLRGIFTALKQDGRILLQMGGKGNAADVLSVLGGIINREKWQQYFTGFNFQYGFYGTEEYSKWLCEAHLQPKRVELIPKDAAHENRGAFEGWIRTTWLPWTQRIPEEKRDQFISEIAEKYLEQYPADDRGVIHVKMVRLEVEARKQ
jgi:trans-aconitate methyltransferase